MARTLGTSIEGDPKEFILQQIHSRAGQVAWWRARVQELAPAESADMLLQGVRGVVQVKASTSVLGGLEDGKTETSESTSKDVGPLIHFALTKWEEAQDALEKLCIAAVKLGLDERRVKLAEDQAAELVGGFKWLLSEARMRLELNDIEARVMNDLFVEMLGRLDARS